MDLSSRDALSLVLYFLGSCFGVFLVVYYTWFGDLEYLSVHYEILRYLSDEWRLFITLVLFSFAVYCFLKLNHEIKKLNKPKLDWWQKGVIYQVYPKSFKDTSGNGIGDLKGIIEKLDYFQKIGVNILYLNPIYPSGGKDNGYDITSYVDIDKAYGEMKDFDILVENLHNRGLYLVMDFIPNHTSNKHEWFIKSFENDKKYKDYYIWYPSNDKINPPNNWVNIVGNSAWTYNEKRKAWYYHSFLPEQPDLNMRNPEVKNEMKKILKFWLEDRQVDGLRVDAVKHLFEHPDFPNEPKNTKSFQVEDDHGYAVLDHIYTLNQPETFEILAEWREFADEIGRRTKSSKVIFIESYGEPQDQIKYLQCNNKPAAHFPMNFQLLNLCENLRSPLCNIRVLTEFKPQNVKKLVDEWNTCSKVKHFWSNWQLGNHDCARVASRIGQENVSLANALILLLGGTPFTYYGEEIGMEDLDYDSMSYDECKDEFGKTYGPEGFKKYNRDYARSPMQWDNSINAGFSSQKVKTWLPVHPNHTAINVEAQLKSPTSPLRIYMDLVKLRQNPSFLWGSFHYAIVDEHMFSFIRNAFDHPSFLVAMNLSDEDIALNFFTTKLVPYTVNVVYYFDNHTNISLAQQQNTTTKAVYVPNQQINTKNIVFKAKSCLVLSWISN